MRGNNVEQETAAVHGLERNLPPPHHPFATTLWKRISRVTARSTTSLRPAFSLSQRSPLQRVKADAAALCAASLPIGWGERWRSAARRCSKSSSIHHGWTPLSCWRARDPRPPQDGGGGADLSARRDGDFLFSSNVVLFTLNPDTSARQEEAFFKMQDSWSHILLCSIPFWPLHFCFVCSGSGKKKKKKISGLQSIFLSKTIESIASHVWNNGCYFANIRINQSDHVVVYRKPGHLGQQWDIQITFKDFFYIYTYKV